MSSHGALVYGACNKTGTDKGTSPNGSTNQWLGRLTHVVFDTTVPDKKAGSCPDPELPGTSLGRGADAGPGPPNLKKKSKLEPGRDGRNIGKGKEEPIRDVMQKDQRPTE